MVSWSAKDDGDPKSYSIADMMLMLSSRKTPEGEVVPVLHVKAPSGEEYDAVGEVGFNTASADIGVGKLDPVSKTNQIIFATYTGGAHCCTNVRVLELIGGTWEELAVGTFQGGGLTEFPKDINGDGTLDIVATDDLFAYAFASFAESFLPPRVFNVVSGSVIEVSKEQQFSNLYRADMQAAQKECLSHNNGACAAFVADASRAGLHDWAWQVMLSNYDANSHWDFPTKCLVPTVNRTCPKGQEYKFTNFPDALDWFLSDTGYTTPRTTPAPSKAR